MSFTFDIIITSIGIGWSVYAHCSVTNEYTHHLCACASEFAIIGGLSLCILSIRQSTFDIAYSKKKLRSDIWKLQIEYVCKEDNDIDIHYDSGEYTS